jgi:hypothetical protein
MHRITLSLFAVALTFAYAGALQGEQAMNNPPRSQADIQKERMAACKQLRGQTFKDCMQNYVGTQKKSQNLDTREAATSPSAAPALHANQSRPEAK